MNIEAGKMYKAENGRRVGPFEKLCTGVSGSFTIWSDFDINGTWRPDGRHSFDSSLDIVSEFFPVVGEVVLGGWMGSEETKVTLPTIDGQPVTGEFKDFVTGHVIKVEGV